MNKHHMLSSFEMGYTPQNLRDLMQQYELSHKELYDFLGKGRNTFQRYLNEADSSNHASMAHSDWLKVLQYIQENYMTNLQDDNLPENIILIAQDFKTDISSLDIEALLQPDQWEKLSQNHPEFFQIEDEIKNWLNENIPVTYQLTLDSSKRKAHDAILINAIKAKIAIEQSELLGLRKLHHGRFVKLYHLVFQNIFKVLNQKYKKHDVDGKLIRKESFTTYLNIEPECLYSRYGIAFDFHEKRIKVLLNQQPDSVYLNLVNDLNNEGKFLDLLYTSVQEVHHDPKDGSDYHTCAYCFRRVKLQPKDRSKIAYHGHTLSKYTYNSILDETCSGSNFAPFEVSSEGTLQALRDHQDRITRFEMQISEIENHKNAGENIQKTDEVNKISSLKYEISSSKRFQQWAIEKIQKRYPDKVEEAKTVCV